MMVIYKCSHQMLDAHNEPSAQFIVLSSKPLSLSNSEGLPLWEWEFIQGFLLDPSASLVFNGRVDLDPNLTISQLLISFSS